MVSDLPTEEAERIQRLPRTQFAQLWTRLKRESPDYAKMATKARCRTDRVLFAKAFFFPMLNKPFSRFHLDTLTAPKTPYRERPPMGGVRRGRMVPRGNGKTTVAIRVEVCHDIVYEFEEYIVIISESALLARARVREIGVDLETNALLREYFGDQKGDVWRVGTGEIETSNGVTVLAKSRKSQVRGLLHPRSNARPTKVIADDFENSEEVLNPELREKDKRFWQEDIEGGGAVDGTTSFEMNGTPLHREALLMRHRDNAGWNFREYPAIERWPDRMDLWERCRQVWASAGARENVEGELVGGLEAVEMARRYYQAHRRKMDEGAKVLWPEGEPLFALMVMRWTNGEAAFSKEKQLEPRDPSLATFEMDSPDYPARGALRHRIVGEHLVIDQRDGTKRKVRLDRLRYIGFHDPAKADPSARGKRSLGDYACIVTLAIEETASGGRFFHVVDAWIEREKAPVSRQIEMAFQLGAQWAYERLILENDVLNLLGKDYRDERNRREKEAKAAAKREEPGPFWQLPLRALDRQTVSKDARIAAMEPVVTNGWMTFNTTLPQVFLNQWIDHPTGDHDDGPDATEGAWRHSGRKASGLRTV